MCYKYTYPRTEYTHIANAFFGWFGHILVVRYVRFTSECVVTGERWTICIWRGPYTAATWKTRPNARLYCSGRLDGKRTAVWSRPPLPPPRRFYVWTVDHARPHNVLVAVPVFRWLLCVCVFRSNSHVIEASSSSECSISLLDFAALMLASSAEKCIHAVIDFSLLTM